MPLSAEDDVDPGMDQIQFRPRKSADAVRKERSIERDDLRDVGYRILGQSSLAGAEGHVAGCLRPSQIGRQRYAYDGRNSTAINGIALHNYHRTAETGP